MKFVYNDGFFLMEVLVTVVVTACITYLIINIITVATELQAYEGIMSSSVNLIGAINDDIEDHTDIKINEGDLKIINRNEVISYEPEGDKVIRRVNGSGYEVVSTKNKKGKFVENKGIILFTSNGGKVEIPIYNMENG